MPKISLNNLSFYAYHGVFQEERRLGSHYQVDLSLEIPQTPAEDTDNLSDTLNYYDIYQIVKAEMQIPSNLLENLAARILNRIKNSFPNIIRAQIKLHKLHPPLDGPAFSVSYETER